MVTPGEIGLGIKFAELVMKNYKTLFKSDGKFRAEIIEKFSEDFPGIKSILVNFLSKDYIFSMFNKLDTGNDEDFQSILDEFQKACADTKFEFDSNVIMKKIKYAAEIRETKTKFEKFASSYLQKASDDHQKIHESIEDMKKLITQNSKHQNSGKQFSSNSAIYTSYIEELKSKLDEEKKSENKFNLTFSDETSSHPLNDLYKFIKSKRRLILNGAAGSGKSQVVLDFVRTLIEKSVFPVFIPINGLEDRFFQDLQNAGKKNFEKQLDTLLNVSKATVTLEHMKDFQGEVWIVIDGINEFSAGRFGELTEKIIKGVGEYVRKTSPKTYVLVTDRIVKRNSDVGWSRIELNALSDDEIRRNLDLNIGKGKYTLNKQNLNLLSKPFFLNMALKRKLTVMTSESAVLKSFFSEQMKLKDDELDTLAAAAFTAYSRHYSISFGIEEFEKMISTMMFEKLVDAEVIVKTSDEHARFIHQILHDYLVSRHLASNKVEWDIHTFDISTKESNSIEVIYLAFQQIQDKKTADKFLLCVYDWNWNAAISSIISNTKLGIASHSEHIVDAMLVQVAQKQFDMIEGTSYSAKKRLEEYDTELSKKLLNTDDLCKLIDVVNDMKYDSAEFMEWKTLFSTNRNSPASYDRIMMIISNNSLIGWTASNVLRECALDATNQNHLETILQSSDANNNTQNTRRWRIIHTLGKFPTESSKKLLFNALENDPYHWCRFGAARSLVEMAAITQDEKIRKSIVDKLIEMLPKLRSNITNEIGKAVFYKNSYGTWDKHAILLLEHIKKLSSDQEYVDEWKNKIEKFENGR